MTLMTYDCKQPTNTTGGGDSLTVPIIEKLHKSCSSILAGT